MLVGDMWKSSNPLSAILPSLMVRWSEQGVVRKNRFVSLSQNVISTPHKVLSCNLLHSGKNFRTKCASSRNTTPEISSLILYENSESGSFAFQRTASLTNCDS